MKRACVIGWPIEHSRSPAIHGYWLARYGIDGTYDKRAVRPEEVDTFLSRLADAGLVGCNVTVPHKEVAFRLASVREPSALAVGAANTLWLDGGRLRAANTDTYGFMTYLDATAPGWRAGSGPISILGAGGAARAIVHGFLEAGREQIVVYNRSRDRSQALAEHFGARITVGDWAARATATPTSAVFVNTTSLGLGNQGSLGIDFAGFDPACVVSDIVYVPLETEFLASARKAGLKTVDGLGMLLHQAVPGFERWFGVRPEVTRELYDLIAAGIGPR